MSDNLDKAYNSKQFYGGYGTSMKVGWNLLNGGTDSDRDAEDWLFVKAIDGSKESYAVLPRTAAIAMRDHLNDLLGEATEQLTEYVAEPVISERAVEAMEELAHQLSVFSTHDLTDALNGFNK